MKKHDKEILQQQLDNEKAVLKKLEQNYKDALGEINSRLAELLGRSDANLQNVIYQINYQKALKAQVEGILKQLQANEFQTVSEYLAKSYEDGFIGSMYSLQKQGVPLVLPIDQEMVVQAIQHETKLSEELYTALGKDTKELQKQIASEISRGITNAAMFSEIARNISSYAGISKNNAMRIARTEGHRIQCKASMDACEKAKSKGADVVKQWDSTLDGKTRDSHRKINGEIRELDEKFSNGLRYPGDPRGKAEEVINCRCALLQRARWALGNEYTKWSEDAPVVIDDDGTTQFVILSDAENYKQFKERYKKAVEYRGGIPKSWKKIDASNDDAVKNANPNYGTTDGYKRNCPNCACAFELRKRGYDVIAKPYTKGGSHYLNAQPWGAWENATVNEISTKKELISFTQEYENGSRFGLALEYTDRSGHVIVGEIVDNELKLYDPQSGQTIKDIDFEDIIGVKLWQTNNIELSDRGRTSCEGR